MIFLKTEDEIELLRASNLLVGKTLAEIAKVIKPGVTTKELDRVAEEFIRDNGAVPTFKGFPNQYGDPFPASICTSVNEQVVHGIPSDNVVLKEGDVVSVDCGTYMNGFCGDSAYTFCVGEVDEEVRKLLKVTKEALYIGIQNAVQGKRLGDIGYAIQQHCESNSYGVVREFVGHGIGKDMHEDPQVPNYGKRGYGTMLKKGLCIAIEPMITLGNRQIVMERDGWTVRTRDCKYAAHFEHITAIEYADFTADGGDILYSASYTATYYSDYIGDVTNNFTAVAVHEGGEWKVEWSPALIFPEMEWGDTVRIARLSAKRGEILSNGEALAKTTGGISVYASVSKIEDTRSVRSTFSSRSFS